MEMYKMMEIMNLWRMVRRMKLMKKIQRIRMTMKRWRNHANERESLLLHKDDDEHQQLKLMVSLKVQRQRNLGNHVKATLPKLKRIPTNLPCLVDYSPPLHKRLIQ